MKRRAFITLFGGAAAAWPLAARAQQPSRIWRVGYLSPAPFTGLARTLFDTFHLRLQELGYVQGRNLILDRRRADGDSTRLPGLAVELVSLRPDVIVAVSNAIPAVRSTTSSIPIVFVLASDPVGSGYVKSLAKPGGNMTGLSYMGRDWTAKSLELLHLIAPSAKRIAVLMSDAPAHASQVKEIQSAAQTWELQIVPVTAIGPAAPERAFEKIEIEKPDGVIVLADSNVAQYRRVVDLAAKTGVPVVYQMGALVRMGGLLSYGIDFVDLFRRSAEYVDRILKGANPAEIPVEQPTKFELVINLKTAKALGVTIPDSVLVRADETIE
jgi:putative ABC transport system substrate-binding protein